MKKFVITCLLLLPMLVKADDKIIGASIIDNENIKAQVESIMTKENDLKKATKGILIEGVGVTCKDKKNEITILNGSLSCENGNKNPYMYNTGDGLSSYAKDAACEDTTNTYYAYGTRTYEYDCAFTGNTPENKKEYAASTTTTTTAQSKDDVNKITTKKTGTTENKDTGIEDYFAVLFTLGILVIGGLYILDKKNIFTRL